VHAKEDVERTSATVYCQARTSLVMDDDTASLYGRMPIMRTRRSNMLTASTGVDVLDRLITANPEQNRLAPQ
jgi:hypothetical protein